MLYPKARQTRRQVDVELARERLRVVRAQRRLYQFELVERAWLLVAATAAVTLAAVGEPISAASVSAIGSAIAAVRWLRLRAPAHSQKDIADLVGLPHPDASLPEAEAGRAGNAR
jgi:hypothetical protein